MAEYQHPRSSDDPNPNPDPAETAGLERGGGVAPGDTPPDADQLTGAVGGNRDNTPNMGPVDGNRTPMFIALGFIAFIVISIAIVTVASFVAR